MIIFDKLQKMHLFEELKYFQNNEIIHGGSQYSNEAPHDFILNFGKLNLESKFTICLNQILNSNIYHFA